MLVTWYCTGIYRALQVSRLPSEDQRKTVSGAGAGAHRVLDQVGDLGYGLPLLQPGERLLVGRPGPGACTRAQAAPAPAPQRRELLLGATQPNHHQAQDQARA